MKNIADLRLYQLISPSLPIGSFTYSQAMEWAVESHWICNGDSLSDWIQTVLEDSFLWLELPLLFRLAKACENKNVIEFSQRSQQLHANRETKELRLEELNRARALLMVLNKLPDSQQWPELFSHREAILQSEIAGFAVAAYHWKIDIENLLTGYVWSWLENTITVAIKLIPLGQSEGQSLLYSLATRIPSLVKRALEIKDEDIGSSTIALAIASSLHETQYTRLFRS